MRRVIISLVLSGLLCSLNAESAQQRALSKMNAEFAAYKAQEQKKFKDYSQNLEKEYSAYKKELEKYWENPKLSTAKEWVSYSDDKRSRSEVDFAKDLIVVEVIASTKEEAQEKLQSQLSYAISKDTKEVIESDPLQKRVVEIAKQSDVVNAEPDAKPILASVLFQKKPTQKELQEYTKKTLKESSVEVSKSKLEDESIYRVEVALPSDTRMKRSSLYKDDVVKNADRFKVSPALVFAIMQTESDFNPFAKSHIPAFGLMQIVPTSAGKDIYQYLYNKKGMPSASYLYNGKNNIEMGSTYLYILYYRYLKKIKNPQSRLYCTIAAYNTGAGNIAWAYTKNYNINSAATLINKMTPDEVYNHLLENLRFDEPKHYLKNVKKRISAYKKAYNL